MNYIAQNDLDGVCQEIDVCRDCTGPAPDMGDSGIENCKAVTPTRYYIESYYNFSGADKMKAELQNGPISCAIQATDEFDAYDGSYIYS